MLEIRNITKIYRSKNGQTVTALDNVSITFPETGMVFLLGKSGSGKSTLLNAIGGLDSVDGGEFIIKGKSSSEFAGSDFDAYRNTFIGFIFQEYNILEEFTVGANIALALELQGKKATDEAINGILQQVDLLDYAKRKPNELSGGQKQRVAIARALVKDPQIIMADEPTGALDSRTGKQIFDTLKALSKTKLVLIVSHDRDFAERYADRIVELADGRIISDVTKHEVKGQQLNDGIKQIGAHILQVKGGYRLTPADVEMINNYLAANPGGLMISGDGRVNGELRSAAGITADGAVNVFEGTNPEKDIVTVPYDGAQTRFIRSRLPMKNAVKMGSSGLKYKKFRLVLTILLSMVSFAMFGLSDTMAAYDKITAATDSIIENRVAMASVALGVRHTSIYKDQSSHWYNSAAMNDEDIASLREQTGLDFVPVYNGTSGSSFKTFSLREMMVESKYTQAFTGELSGFVHLTQEQLDTAGYRLVGRMPQNAGEIVITEFMYRQFNTMGFSNAKHGESVGKGELTMNEGEAKSIIGKHLTTDKWLYDYSGIGAGEVDLVIVGVVDTGFDYNRYEVFLPKEEDRRPTTSDDVDIGTLILSMELEDVLHYGFHALGLVSAEDIAEFSKYIDKGYRELGQYINFEASLGGANDYSMYKMGGNDLLPVLKILWLDGTPRTALAEGEYLVHMQQLSNLLYSSEKQMALRLTELEEKAIALYGEENWQKVKNEDGTWDEMLHAAHKEKYGNTETFEQTRESVFSTLREIFSLKYPQYANFDNCLYGKYSGIEVGAVLELYRQDLACEQLIGERNLMGDPAFLAALTVYCREMGVENMEILTDPQRMQLAADFYKYNVLSRAGTYTPSNELTPEEFEAQSMILAMGKIDAWRAKITAEKTLTLYSYDGSKDTKTDVFAVPDLKLVGVFTDQDASGMILSETVLREVGAYKKTHMLDTWTEVTAPHEDGCWAFALAAMPSDRAGVEKLVTMSYATGQDLQFTLRNQVMTSLRSFNEFIEVGATIFLWVGVGFAVFSALLLMNFISISISYKKREIGILRAVGARSSDVFKIFFSEAFIIALINFFLACVAVNVAVFAIGRWMYSKGINITLLHFGIRQFALMLVVSIGVAAIASFLPVWRIARKKPVDAIKDR